MKILAFPADRRKIRGMVTDLKICDLRSILENHFRAAVMSVELKELNSGATVADVVLANGDLVRVTLTNGESNGLENSVSNVGGAAAP